jgi:hypothetical protein
MEDTIHVVEGYELPPFGIIAPDETAYVSDMQHDGHCTCGHTAADHA